MTFNFLIFFSPIIFLIFLSESTIDDNLMYAEINLGFKEITNNFKNWFYIHFKNIGFINLIIFLLSVLFFIFKDRKKITNKILIIIFSHLLLSLCINGFMNYHIRTTIYSTFIILIINFIFLASIIKFKEKFFLIFLGIIFINFSQQMYMIFNKDYFIELRADIYNFYFKDIDEKKNSSENESINNINKLISANGKIIFFTNLSEDVYFIYSKRDLKKIKYKYLKPIKNLVYYQKKGGLEKYLNKIHYKKINIDNTYILSIDTSVLNVIEEFNILDKTKIFKNNCKIIPEAIFKDTIFISGERKIFLNKIECK